MEWNSEKIMECRVNGEISGVTKKGRVQMLPSIICVVLLEMQGTGFLFTHFS